MRAPVFGHGHLRLYLLSLLAERSQHGYELIQALEERFGGTYTPSAGTIYPRLAKLEAEGLVTKTADGRKTVYAITDAGRAELEARETELDDIEQQVTDSVRRLADEVRASVNEAMKTLRADLAAAGREAQREARWKKRNGGTETTSATPTRPSSPMSDSQGTETSHAAAWDAGPARASSEFTERAASEPSASEPSPAASGDAFASPKPEHGQDTESGPVASRVTLRRVEATLASFRNDVRAELRTRAARGRLDDRTVERLEAALEAARATLR